MKKALFFLALTAALFSAACKKGACIEGSLLDSKTNKPVSSARVDLTYGYSEVGSQKTATATVYSDQSGGFSFSNDEKYSNPIHVLDVQHAEYAHKFVVEQFEGDCVDAQVKLTPLDGVLKLTITNETGANDTVYAGVFNKCNYRFPYYSGVSLTQPAAIVLQKGEQFTQTFSTCAGDSSALVWRFGKYGSWTGVDSIWVGSKDEVSREIKY